MGEKSRWYDGVAMCVDGGGGAKVFGWLAVACCACWMQMSMASRMGTLFQVTSSLRREMKKRQ